MLSKWYGNFDQSADPKTCQCWYFAAMVIFSIRQRFHALESTLSGTVRRESHFSSWWSEVQFPLISTKWLRSPGHLPSGCKPEDSDLRGNIDKLQSEVTNAVSWNRSDVQNQAHSLTHSVPYLGVHVLWQTTGDETDVIIIIIIINLLFIFVMQKNVDFVRRFLCSHRLWNENISDVMRELEWAIYASKDTRYWPLDLSRSIQE